MLLQSQVKQRLQQYDPLQSHYQTYQSKPWKSRLRLVFTSTLPRGAISLSLSLSLNIYIYIYIPDYVQHRHWFLDIFALVWDYKESLIAKWNLRLPNATKYRQGLSIHSFSAAILPDPRPPIFPNVADNPLKLLLPSLKFRDFLDFLSFGEPISPMSWSASLQFLILATARRTMVLRQNGQTGGLRHAVVGLGLLWQQRASVHCAHIWWPQSWTSIVQTCSKHMQHTSVSLACIIYVTK